MTTLGGTPEPWERISSYYAATRKPINVLVAPTADAAAASLSLAYLMKVFLFPFKLHPTASYDEVKSFIDQTNAAQDSERIEANSPLIDDLFVLVGLGAPVRLEDYFDFARHIVVVMDAYRPFHLDNLRREDGERCIVWGSERIHGEIDTFFRVQRAAEAQRRRRRRRRQAMKRHRRSDRHGGAHLHPPSRRHRLQRADDNDNGEDDSDAGGDSAGKSAARARGRGLDGSDSDNGSEDGDDVYSEESSLSTSSSDADEDEDASSGSDGDADLFDGEDDDATPSQSQDRIDWRSTEAEAVPAFLEARYYACAGAGRSSAVEMYDLSVMLHRFNDALLWHAAVGVCDLYQRRLIDYGTYLVDMAPLQEAVSLQQSVRRGVLRDRTEEAVNSYQRASTNGMQLSNREEEQLYLLRHSTLWDAIWFDPQVASVLDLHHVEDGRPRLSQLLASRCGVSIAMAQRPWHEVPADVASEALRRVQAELQSWANAQGNLTGYRHHIRGITRRVGYSTEVSTFDACKLFTAEMAAVPAASVYVVERSADGTALTPAEVAAASQQRLVEFQRGQFWRARAVLDMDPNEKPFHAALAGALSLQQAVADATSSMMQPGSVQSSTGLHYALPTDPSKTSPTLESFCTMRRLAVLADRLFFTLSVSRRRERRLASALRPLLLSCPLPQARQAAQPAGVAGGGAVPSGPGMSGLAAPPGQGNAGSLSTTTGGATAAAAALLAGGAQVEDTAEYVVVLTHAGNNSAGHEPLLPVHRFAQCLCDEHFNAAPRQAFVERNAVQVRGRENTTYLAERMLLLSVKASIPRDEFRISSAGAAVDEDGNFEEIVSDDGELRSGDDDDTNNATAAAVVH